MKNIWAGCIAFVTGMKFAYDCVYFLMYLK